MTIIFFMVDFIIRHRGGNASLHPNYLSTDYLVNAYVSGGQCHFFVVLPMCITSDRYDRV